VTQAFTGCSGKRPPAQRILACDNAIATEIAEHLPAAGPGFQRYRPDARNAQIGAHFRPIATSPGDAGFRSSGWLDAIGLDAANGRRTVCHAGRMKAGAIDCQTMRVSSAQVQVLPRRCHKRRVRCRIFRSVESPDAPRARLAGRTAVVPRLTAPLRRGTAVPPITVGRCGRRRRRP